MQNSALVWQPARIVDAPGHEVSGVGLSRLTAGKKFTVRVTPSPEKCPACGGPTVLLHPDDAQKIMRMSETGHDHTGFWLCEKFVLTD